MSERVVADLSALELIEEFRKLAGELGSAWSLSTRPERYRKTPEREARLARMNLLTPEMRTRAPAQTLRALLEAPDVDVRVWAMMRFAEVDPAFAKAASAGVAEGITTREAQGRIAHARLPPPTVPALADMPLDEVVARFSDACIRKYWARHCGEDGDPFDVELHNKIHFEVRDIVSELRRRDACDRLLPLLDSANITQRADAARATFEVDPERALKTLEAVSASADLYEFWRADQSLRAFRERAPDVVAPRPTDR